MTTSSGNCAPGCACGKHSKQREKRTLTMEGWLKLRWSDVQMPWDELWMNMAHLVSMRSRCSRDRVGCVIVNNENQLLSIGYNGAAASAPVDSSWCSAWCERAIKGARGESLHPDYQDCHALHAEFNAIMSMPESPADAYNTLYVTSAMCYQCAKTVAAALRVRHVTRVIMKATPASLRQRNGNDVTAYLQECGIEVIIWGHAVFSYRKVFQDAHGLGPHACHFCDVVMPRAEVIHHVNHDHTDNSVTNLAAAHAACHTRYHISANPTGQTHAHQARSSVTTNWERRKPYLKCKTCGISVTPGWLKRHADTTGHDGSAYDEWRAQEMTQRAANAVKTCAACRREFSSGSALASHQRGSQCVVTSPNKHSNVVE